MSHLFSHVSHAEPPAHHKITITAIQKCLRTIKIAVEKGASKKPSIACNIPFSFKEVELDAILSQSGSNQQSLEQEKQTDKTSHSTVKTLINVRSAKCKATVRVKTALVKKAINMKNGKLIIPPQWVSCNLTTKSRKTKQVRFAFTPTGTFKQNCLNQFSPKMGKFDLDCTFCRLNFVAHTLRYWVNQMGTQMKPGINKALGKTCKT